MEQLDLFPETLAKPSAWPWFFAHAAFPEPPEPLRRVTWADIIAAPAEDREAVTSRPLHQFLGFGLPPGLPNRPRLKLIKGDDE